jgi:hypothetical protein
MRGWIGQLSPPRMAAASQSISGEQSCCVTLKPVLADLTLNANAAVAYSAHD